MSLWFTSDLHLGHANICRLAERPFASVQEMDEALIDNWNSVVDDGDGVYILGDLAMGNLHESLAKVKALKGDKRLIPGNHDRVFSGNSPAYIGRHRMRYHDAGLTLKDEHHEAVISLSDAGSYRVLMLMNHFPFRDVARHEDKWVEHLPTPPTAKRLAAHELQGYVLLHGHTHSRERWDPLTRSIHVGVDAWNYTPVPYSAIKALASTNIIDEASITNYGGSA